MKLPPCTIPIYKGVLPYVALLVLVREPRALGVQELAAHHLDRPGVGRRHVCCAPLPDRIRRAVQPLGDQAALNGEERLIIRHRPGRRARFRH